jgi:aminopeptidase-like protein
LPVTDFEDIDRVGREMHDFARRLWPLPRSISGEGLRATLRAIGERLPGFELFEVPSGSRVLDWIVPDEWWVRAAWIEAPDGRRICDFAVNNLHLVGYSTGVDAILSREELDAHLHSLPGQPEAIPYVTSYYERRWGFCLAHREREALPAGPYRVFIDAGHRAGSITYGECVIPGESEQEVLLSTYCCHPSMANNELSGPVLTAQLGEWLARAPRRLSYRLLFLPEMIGSIAYLARMREHLQRHVIAGFQLTCVGDERAWGFLPSRGGDTLADRAVRHVLQHLDADYTRWCWLDRGSDESNWCAPGVDLPVASVFRSKYGSYPEYHTSLDDLEHVVTPRGLGGSFRALRRIIEILEADVTPRTTVLGEPQLGRRGLYPSLAKKGSTAGVRRLLDLLSYADGKHSLLEIADLLDCPFHELLEIATQLAEKGLLTMHADPR